MPRYARPASSRDIQDPIAALGSLLNASVIGYLRENGPAGRAAIASGLDIPPMTVANALSSLHAAGLLIADPPLDRARQGQRVRYRVNNAAVSEMYLQLGQAIGEL